MAGKKLKKLSRDEKIAFVLKYREGHSAKTVGKEAKVSENTILRWSRALEAVEKRALTQKRRRTYMGARPSTEAVKKEIADAEGHASSHAHVLKRLAYLEGFLSKAFPLQFGSSQ